MTEILTLAADFIERMSNPAYGVAVNEEYSLRFAQLLERERVAGLLNSEAREERDVNALTAHGWLWFLNWARGNDLEVNGDLLLDLSDRYSSVFMQVLIIDVATRNVESVRTGGVATVDDFGNDWLRALMIRSIRQEPQPEVEEKRPFDGQERVERNEERPVRTGRAETSLLALLQVDRPITINAAATLLRHPWAGRDQLANFYRWRVSDLEAESREMWEERLGI